MPPAELTATCAVVGERARAAAAASGLARESAPGAMLLSGPRADVLRAVVDIVDASLEAGARSLDVRFEAPTETRGGQTP